VRAEAVSFLPVFGEGAEGAERFQHVTTLLADDPDRGVRIAAAERLGESESPEAVRPLVLALSDPDRDVVLAAIEALEDVDDVSAIPDLELLLEDHVEEIRDAAESAIQNIE
jgi:HEAT repeat protein